MNKETRMAVPLDEIITQRGPATSARLNEVVILAEQSHQSGIAYGMRDLVQPACQAARGQPDEAAPFHSLLLHPTRSAYGHCGASVN
jgi:hypothetical protein